MPWAEDDAAPHADMYATAEEPAQDILDLADRCAAAADATIGELDLDAVATVAWWARPQVTLGRLLVQMVQEYARHLGHVDIVRQLLDGHAGLKETASNLPGEQEGVDPDWWHRYTERLRAIAEACGD